MVEGKEEKKGDEKGKDSMEEKKKEGIEVITAIYRVNLHCPQCGSKIKKHLMTTEGENLFLFFFFHMLLYFYLNLNS